MRDSGSKSEMRLRTWTNGLEAVRTARTSLELIFGSGEGRCDHVKNYPDYRICQGFSLSLSLSVSSQWLFFPFFFLSLSLLVSVVVVLFVFGCLVMSSVFCVHLNRLSVGWQNQWRQKMNPVTRTKSHCDFFLYLRVHRRKNAM